MIYYLRLKQQFDARALYQEVQQMADNWWKEHYQKKHYEGNWSIIPLRSLNGDPDNIYSIHSTGNAAPVYKDTPFLQQCPGLSAVLDFFQCEKTAVRLMKLEAGAVIKEHTDQEMSFEEGEARFHIPLQTNAQVDFYLLDERIPMQEGECWYLNLSLPHRVTNGGTSDRIHLVVDCLVNDWVKELFAEGADCIREIDKAATTRPASAEEQKLIIAELRRMNTAAANELANKMETDQI